MVYETTEYQNELMQHTCGLVSGEIRNWFGACANSKAAHEFDKMVDMGLATKGPAPSFWCDDFIYKLTDKGLEAAEASLPAPPKRTRSQERYQRFLEYGECFESFIEYCRWDAEPERSWNSAR